MFVFDDDAIVNRILSSFVAFKSVLTTANCHIHMLILFQLTTTPSQGLKFYEASQKIFGIRSQMPEKCPSSLPCTRVFMNNIGQRATYEFPKYFPIDRIECFSRVYHSFPAGLKRKVKLRTSNLEYSYSTTINYS